MNKIVKNTLIVTLITVIAGFLLGVVYEVTKTPISQAQETAKKEAWQAVFSDVKLGDFKAEDVDQKAADKAVKVDDVHTSADRGANLAVASEGSLAFVGSLFGVTD